LWAWYGRFRGEAFAERGGKIADFAHGEFSLGVQRVVELPPPVSGLAQRDAEVAQLGFGFAEKLHYKSLLFHYFTNGADVRATARQADWVLYFFAGAV
jgi:hypothetical protein